MTIPDNNTVARISNSEEEETIDNTGNEEEETIDNTGNELAAKLWCKSRPHTSTY
jgi:hypothetical protein